MLSGWCVAWLTVVFITVSVLVPALIAAVLVEVFMAARLVARLVVRGNAMLPRRVMPDTPTRRAAGGAFAVAACLPVVVLLAPTWIFWIPTVARSTTLPVFVAVLILLAAMVVRGYSGATAGD